MSGFASGPGFEVFALSELTVTLEQRLSLSAGAAGVFLGHCFLRGITWSGVRLGAVPALQPGSLMLALSPLSHSCSVSLRWPNLQFQCRDLTPKGDVFLRKYQVSHAKPTAP